MRRNNNMWITFILSMTQFFVYKIIEQGMRSAEK